MAEEAQTAEPEGAKAEESEHHGGGVSPSVVIVVHRRSLYFWSLSNRIFLLEKSKIILNDLVKI